MSQSLESCDGLQVHHGLLVADEDVEDVGPFPVSLPPITHVYNLSLACRQTIPTLAPLQYMQEGAGV